MRKISALLALVLVAGLALFVPSTAQAAPLDISVGHHTTQKTVDGPGSSSVTVFIDYNICCPTTDGSLREVDINWFSWDASGDQLLDAICVDYEGGTPGNYYGNYCGYVGSSSAASSANYNDIPNTGTFSPGMQYQGFATADTPAFRIRTYGQNNVHGSAGRVDGYVAM